MYARALFQAARDEGRLGPVRDELRDLVAVVEEVPQLRSVLENPEVDAEAKGAILSDVLGEADPLVRNFLRLLAEKGRSAEIDEIAREYDVLVDAEERVLNVELTTAFELSDDEAREIVGKIEQASGRSVEASRKVDPALIGGLVLQAGSLRVDASVRGRLERLRHDLTGGTQGSPSDPLLPAS
jgi:F-type H+-transporting ATPase subunit delta